MSTQTLTNIKNNPLQYIIMFYAFIIPLSKASVAIFAFVFFIIILATHKNNYKNTWLRVWNNTILKYFLIFIALHIFSLIFIESIDFNDAILYIKRYIYLIIPAIAIYTILKKEFISKVLSSFIVGMFISELLSYGIFFELITLKHGTPSDPTPFMNHLDYSIFLVFTSLILLNRVINIITIKEKIIYFLFFCSTTANLFITGGRIGQLAFFVSIFVIFFINYEHKVKAFFTSLLLTISMFLVAYNFSSTFHNRLTQGINNLNNVIYQQNYCTSWGMRIGAWFIAKDIIVENPIIGVGVQNHIVQLRYLIDTKYPDMKCLRWFSTYHNQYLDTLTQFGILGFILFISIFILILKLRFTNKEYKNLSIIFVTIFAVGFTGDAFFYRYFIVGFFGIFLGLILKASEVKDNKERI